MESSDTSERLFDDTLSGALARREKFLGKTTISESEEMQIFSVMQRVRELAAKNPNVHKMTKEHAIDKLTAEALFRQRFPAWKGVKEVIAMATEDISFDDGLIVYRLLNGDWLEPIFGHYIPACMPWVQHLETILQNETANENAATDVQGLVEKHQTDTAQAAAKKMHEASR